MGIFDCQACACAAAPAAPDYSGIAASSDKAAELGYQAASDNLAFQKQVYNQSLPYIQNMQGLATQIANQQLASSQKAQDQSNQQWQYYQNTFQPVERQTVMDAMGSQYLSDADRAQLASIINGNSGLSGDQQTLAMDSIARNAGNAAGDYASQQAQAQTNSAYAQQARQLMRSGYNPNKIANAAASLAQQQNLGLVGASNQARQAQADKYSALRSGVGNFGRNMPNTSATQMGLATQTGNSSVANATQAANGLLPAGGLMQGAYGLQLGAAGQAQQGALGLGGLYANTYGSQLGYAAAMNNAMMGQGGNSMAGIGSLLGGAAAVGKLFI